MTFFVSNPSAFVVRLESKRVRCSTYLRAMELCSSSWLRAPVCVRGSNYLVSLSLGMLTVESHPLTRTLVLIYTHVIYTTYTFTILTTPSFSLSLSVIMYQEGFIVTFTFLCVIICICCF